MEDPRNLNENLQDSHFRRGPLTVYFDNRIGDWERLLDKDLENFNMKYYEPMYLSMSPLDNYSKNCSLCDVDWSLDHASLDCRECDGYPMARPCVACGGKCENMWKRDLVASHLKNKAVWTGECKWINSLTYASNKNENKNNCNSSTETKIENSGSQRS